MFHLSRSARYWPNAVAVALLSDAALFASAFRAEALDAKFDCAQPPHEFITELINAHAIAPTPMHVEANSVNAFRSISGSDLSAFGFPVYAVLGYEPHDQMFRKGDGQAISGPVYGAVLSGPRETIETRVREAGSKATVRTVVPFLLTAVVCGPP
jgi:hypothetical protein